MEIAKLFLEMGAGPIDSFEDSNDSPLCEASYVRNIYIYHCIGLHFFCEINYEFVYSVDFALQKGHLEVVKFLVENGAIGVDRALFLATQVFVLFCFLKSRCLIAHLASF